MRRLNSFALTVGMALAGLAASSGATPQTVSVQAKPGPVQVQVHTAPQMPRMVTPRAMSPVERTDMIRNLTGDPTVQAAGAPVRYGIESRPASGGHVTLRGSPLTQVGNDYAWIDPDGLVQISLAAPGKPKPSGIALFDCFAMNLSGPQWFVLAPGSSVDPEMLGSSLSGVGGSFTSGANGHSVFAVDLSLSKDGTVFIHNSVPWIFRWCDVTLTG